jgi:hypothetical protein
LGFGSGPGIMTRGEGVPVSGVAHWTGKRGTGAPAGGAKGPTGET